MHRSGYTNARRMTGSLEAWQSVRESSSPCSPWGLTGGPGRCRAHCECWTSESLYMCAAVARFLLLNRPPASLSAGSEQHGLPQLAIKEPRHCIDGYPFRFEW